MASRRAQTANERPVPTKGTYTNEALWAGKTPRTTELVSVQWRDITSIANWNEEEEVAPVRHFSTVGYLLYEGPDPKDEGEEMVVIASTWDGDAAKWRDYTVFPAPVVRSIAAMVKPRKRKAK